MSLSKKYNQYQKQQNLNASILNSKSNDLRNQTNAISDVLTKQQTLNESYNDSIAILNANYYKYIGFILISVLLVLLLIKFSVVNNGQSGGGSNFQKEAILLFIIMIFTSLFSKISDKYYGYIIVSVISILYIYSKIKLYQ